MGLVDQGQQLPVAAYLLLIARAERIDVQPLEYPPDFGIREFGALDAG